MCSFLSLSLYLAHSLRQWNTNTTSDSWRKTGQIPKVMLLGCIWPIYHVPLRTHTHTDTNHACIKTYWNAGTLRPHYYSVSLQTHLHSILCSNALKQCDTSNESPQRVLFSHSLSHCDLCMPQRTTTPLFNIIIHRCLRGSTDNVVQSLHNMITSINNAS